MFREAALAAAVLDHVVFPRRWRGAWSPAELQVLLFVGARPGKTGAEITRWLRLSEGTVSVTCSKLVAANLMEGPSAEASSSSKRRYLTNRGHALAEELLQVGMNEYESWTAEHTGGIEMAGTFTIYIDDALDYRWRYSSPDGRVSATSREGYTAKDDAIRAVEHVKATAAAAGIVEA